MTCAGDSCRNLVFAYVFALVLSSAKLLYIGTMQVSSELRNERRDHPKYEGRLVSIIKQLVFALCVCCGMTSLAHARAPDESRGELLYSTHCNTCHTSVIHWREQKLATDWKSLKGQVSRWQAYAKLGWREEDIVDVALYLNSRYYKFLSTEPKALSQRKETRQTLREY